MANQLIARPLSTNDIISFVKIIRKSFNLHKKLDFPVITFVEKILPEIDPQFNYDYLPQNQMPDKYAYYDNCQNIMVIREDVYDAACNNDGRARFTIAHEIGHYFLHQDGVKLCRMATNEKVVAYLDPEWQANTFASELLMPRHLIAGMSPSEISTCCKTSFQAASIAYEKAKKPSFTA